VQNFHTFTNMLNQLQPMEISFLIKRRTIIKHSFVISMLHIQKCKHVFFQIQGRLFCPTSPQHLCKLIDSPVTSKVVKSQEAEQPRPASCLCCHDVLRGTTRATGLSWSSVEHPLCPRAFL